MHKHNLRHYHNHWFDTKRNGSTVSCSRLRVKVALHVALALRKLAKGGRGWLPADTVQGKGEMGRQE